MTTAEQIFQLWKVYGWDAEDARVHAYYHPWEGPAPKAKPEDEIKVELGEER